MTTPPSQHQNNGPNVPPSNNDTTNTTTQMQPNHKKTTTNAISLHKSPRLSTYQDHLTHVHPYWLQYISQLPSHMILNGIAFMKLEYVGALITVLQAANPSFVGKRGIIVDESMHKFRIITRVNNRVISLDKKRLVFELEANEDALKLLNHGASESQPQQQQQKKHVLQKQRLLIHAEKLILRPVERTTKRYKT